MTQLKFKTNVCTICGKPFTTHDVRVKTCSPECAAKQKAINHKKFMDKKAGRTVETFTLNCLVCGKEFTTDDARVRTCSEECKVEYANNVKKYSVKNYHDSLSGIEGVDYVTCKWCGEKVKRIFGKHIETYHKGKTSEDYKREFSGAPLTTSTDIANFSRSSGLHMKEDKYRNLASEKMKGELNPNHSSRTTESERAERSPFSPAFYEKRGLTENDRTKFIDEALKGREFENSSQYWLNRGYTIEEAIDKVHDRQTTFSIEKCVERYGEENGLAVWKARQELWKSKVFNEDTYIGGGTSKLATTIIDEIVKGDVNGDQLKYGKDEKFVTDTLNKRVYKYDITNIATQRMIEINGNFWHCKPGLYEESFVNPVKQLTAKEIWDYDKRKTEIAESYGYKVMTVWEDEYYADPDGTIDRCIDFIYHKTR